MTNYVYILECADNTLYTGYTTDVARRIDQHNSGDGAKYTTGRTPVTLRRVELFDSRSAAQSREYEIKQLPRHKKLDLLPDQEQAVSVQP